MRAHQAQYLIKQVIGHVDQARMVHRQGGRKLLAHRMLDPSAHFHRHQRVHTKIEESGLFPDLGRIDLGHLRHELAQVLDDHLLAPLHRAAVSCSTNRVGPDDVPVGTESGTSRSNSAKNARLPVCW